MKVGGRGKGVGAGGWMDGWVKDKQEWMNMWADKKMGDGPWR